MYWKVVNLMWLFWCGFWSFLGILVVFVRLSVGKFLIVFLVGFLVGGLLKRLLLLSLIGLNLFFVFVFGWCVVEVFLCFVGGLIFKFWCDFFLVVGGMLLENDVFGVLFFFFLLLVMIMDLVVRFVCCVVVCEGEGGEGIWWVVVWVECVLIGEDWFWGWFKLKCYEGLWIREG